MAVGNPRAAKANGVDVDHPTIRKYTENLAKKGVSKEEAQKIIGMPGEVIDRIYREVKK